jgi:hypothetical protein
MEEMNDGRWGRRVAHDRHLSRILDFVDRMY